MSFDDEDQQRAAKTDMHRIRRDADRAYANRAYDVPQAATPMPPATIAAYVSPLTQLRRLQAAAIQHALDLGKLIDDLPFINTTEQHQAHHLVQSNLLATKLLITGAAKS